MFGTGSRRYGRHRNLVFAMRVSEVMTYNAYWMDNRFQVKKPNLSGSNKLAYGDNIYFRSDEGIWHQANSHHSHPDGSPNRANIDNDTQTDRILVSDDFAYWGGVGPEIPGDLTENATNLCAVRGHKCIWPEGFAERVVTWFRSLDQKGFQGEPLEWGR